MKVKIKATKMLDANASHISLVDRGANRTPFKIVKQEKAMPGFLAALDLTQVFARKAEKPGVEIVGVVTMKGDHLEAVKKMVEDAGFKVAEQVEMDDGAVVFKQEGTPEGKGVTLRLSDDVALVLKNFTPHEMDIEADGQTFAQTVEAQGFYPSLSAVADQINAAAFDIVSKAENAADAAEAVAALFDEAKLYATTMVGALPSSVFKLEQAALAFEPPAKVEKEEAKEEPAQKEEPESKEEPAKKEEDKAGEQTPAQKQENQGISEAKPLTADDVSNIVRAQTENLVGSLTKKMEEALSALSTSVQKSLKDISGSVEEATATAKKAEAAVKGAVVTGSDHADRGVRKSELGGEHGGREIDTGYMTREQRQARRRQ